jgi:hypothetical protein
MQRPPKEVSAICAKTVIPAAEPRAKPVFRAELAPISPLLRVAEALETSGLSRPEILRIAGEGHRDLPNVVNHYRRRDADLWFEIFTSASLRPGTLDRLLVALARALPPQAPFYQACREIGILS